MKFCGYKVHRGWRTTLGVHSLFSLGWGKVSSYKLSIPGWLTHKLQGFSESTTYLVRGMQGLQSQATVYCFGWDQILWMRLEYSGLQVSYHFPH